METHSPKESDETRARTFIGTRNQGSHGETANGGPFMGSNQIELIQNSPQMATQQKRLEQAFGIPLQKKVQKENKTQMPDALKTGMETSFNRDFSHVRVHTNSSKAPEVGALAYTQGSDVHFAPGQFRPNSSQGRQLIGHELAHVVQQGDGRVSPTTQVNGMPVNDNPSLEKEADILGSRAAG
jgi:hypothetical protein